MKGVPVSHWLVDFGAAAAAGGGAVGSALSTLNNAQPRKRLTVAEAKEKAHERSFMEGRLAALGEIDAKLQSQADDYEQDLAAERRAWIKEQSGLLSSQMRDGFRDLEEALAHLAADALRPILSAAVSRSAIAEFSELLRRSFESHDGAGITVTGPADLLELLRRDLAGLSASVSFTPGESDCEVRSVVGHKILETNLAAWAETINEVAQ